MNIDKISNLKDLLGQLEYIDHVIKSIEENAEKLLSEKSEVSIKIKINYPESSKKNILDEDGSLRNAHMQNYMSGMFSHILNDMKLMGKKESDVKIEINDIFAIEIFSLVRKRAIEEREKILKKLKSFE